MSVRDFIVFCETVGGRPLTVQQRALAEALLAKPHGLVVLHTARQGSRGFIQELHERFMQGRRADLLIVDDVASNTKAAKLPVENKLPGDSGNTNTEVPMPTYTLDELKPLSKHVCGMLCSCQDGSECSTARLEILIEKSRSLGPMTDEDKRLQRIDWVYGNCALSNPKVTREMAEAAVDSVFGPPLTGAGEGSTKTAKTP